MTSYEIFDRCNETELYQRCRKAGLTVRPGTTKKEMIAYLLGDESPPKQENEMDTTRMGLIGFLLDYWSIVRSQISCPAKALDGEVDENFHPKPGWEERVSNSRKPLACFTCVDTQVLSCLVQNETNRHLIQLKKKPVPEEPMTMSPVTSAAPTPDTAPRDLEGLKNLKRYNLRRLMEQLNAFTDEKSLSSFLAAPLEEQAQAAKAVLEDYDRRRVGGTATPVAAPAAAPEPPKAAPKRQPSNGGAVQASVSMVPASPPPAASGEVATLIAVVKELCGKVDQFEGRLAEVSRAVQGLKGGQESTATTLKVQQEITKVQLGYLSLFGEQVLGAGRDEILKDAIRDGQAILQTLGKGLPRAPQLSPGRARF